MALFDSVQGEIYIFYIRSKFLLNIDQLCKTKMYHI